LARLNFDCTRLSSRIATAHCTCENSTARAVAHSTSAVLQLSAPAQAGASTSALAQRGLIKSNFNYRSPAAVTTGLAHSVNRSAHCSLAPLGGIVFIRSLRHVSVPAVNEEGFFEVFSR
jgi:hypothetical protein